MTPCPSCRAALPPGARFCLACGTKLPGGSPVLIGCLIAGGLAALLLAVGAVVVYYFAVQPKPPPAERPKDSDDDHARGRPEDAAARIPRRDAGRLDECWVVPQILVALDWTPSANDPAIAELRACLIEMNRRLYDATDGQMRIGKIYLLDKLRADQIHAPGVMTFHWDWLNAREEHPTPGFDPSLLGFAHRLGDPASPAHMHVGYEHLKKHGTSYYGGVLLHEWLHAFIGVGDEYKSARAVPGSECPKDLAVRTEWDSCVMYNVEYTELCRSGNHNTDTWHHAAHQTDCYSHLAAVVNRHAAGRTGPLQVPSRLYHGPTDAPEPEFEVLLGRSTPTASASVSMDRVWVDAGTDGVTVHASFGINGFKDRDGMMSAYFTLADGTPLRDFNQRYATTDGHVAAGAAFRPGYDPGRYEDLQVFIPYEELHMNPGRWNLRCTVKVWDARPEGYASLADGGPVDFVYQTGAEPTASIEGMVTDGWVEEGGQTGLRIRAAFTVNQHVGHSGFVAVYFSYANGGPLKDLDGVYVGAQGAVATGAYVTPLYDSSVFSDTPLFIPYDQLHLADGVLHELQYHLEVMAEVNGVWVVLARSAPERFTVDARR